MEQLNICRNCDAKVGDTVNLNAYDGAGLCPICGKVQTMFSESSHYMYVHLHENKIIAIASVDIIGSEDIDADYAKILSDAGWSFRTVSVPNFDVWADPEPEYVTLAWKNFDLDMHLVNPLNGNVLHIENHNCEAFEDAKELYHTGSLRLFRFAERVPKNPKWVAEKEAKLAEQRAYRELNDLPF